MPTNSHLYEGARDRFCEAQPLPIATAARFFCPICRSELPSAEDRAWHVADAHRLEQPCLYIRGRRVGVRERIRKPFSPTDVVVVSCDELHVDSGRGSRACSTEQLACALAQARQGSYEVELLRRRAGDGATSRAAYRIEFDIAEESDLAKVDQLFVGLLARPDLTMADVERFGGACDRTTAIGYADALCSYVVGILLKEQNPGSGTSLPFERFADKLRTAFEGIRDIETPLAATVRTAIRLSLNDFADPLPQDEPRSTVAAAYLRFATIARIGATSAVDEARAEGAPICPLDVVTADLTRSVLRRSGKLPEPDYQDLARRAEASEIAPWDRTKYAVLLAQAAMARGDLAVADHTLRGMAHDAAFGRWAETKLAELS